MDINIITLWKQFAADCDCNHIAATICAVCDIKMFSEYADDILRGDTLSTPDFVQRDLAQQKAGLVYNALVFPSRYAATSEADKEKFETEAKRKWLKNNYKCLARIRGYIFDVIDYFSFAYCKHEIIKRCLRKQPTDINEVQTWISLVSESDFRAILTVLTEDIPFNVTEGGLIRCALQFPGSRQVLNEGGTQHFVDITSGDTPVIGPDLSVQPNYFIKDWVQDDSPSKVAFAVGIKYSELCQKLLKSYASRARLTHDIIYMFAPLVDDALKTTEQPGPNLVTLKMMRKQAWADYPLRLRQEYFDELAKFSECGAPLSPNKARFEENIGDTYKNRYDFRKNKINQIDTSIWFQPIKWQYATTRVTTVPKDYKSRRTITPISDILYYWVYGRDIALRNALEKVHPDEYCFRNQKAQWAALAAGWKSADHSSASDLIDVYQVIACFPTLWQELLTYRPYIAQVDSCRYALGMYSGMGHSLCFPVENEVFITTFKAGLPSLYFLETGNHFDDQPFKVRQANKGKRRTLRVRGHGDDLMFEPHEKFDLDLYVKTVSSCCGWKLNEKKSFLKHSDSNGETCGAFRINGEIWEMIRLCHGFGGREQLHEVLGMIALERCLFMNNKPRSANYLARALADVGVTASGYTQYEVLVPEERLYVEASDAIRIFATDIKIDFPEGSKDQGNDDLAYYIHNIKANDFVSDIPKIAPLPEFLSADSWHLVKGKDKDLFDVDKLSDYVELALKPSGNDNRVYHYENNGKVADIVLPEITSPLRRDLLNCVPTVRLVQRQVEVANVPLEDTETVPVINLDNITISN